MRLSFLIGSFTIDIRNSVGTRAEEVGNTTPIHFLHAPT